MLSGMLFGLILSFSLGPIFFELINTSLRKGFKAAFFMDIGVVVSDLIYLFIAYFSAQQIVTLIQENEYVKYIGGGIFIAFGLFSILKKINFKKNAKEDDLPDDDIIDSDIIDKTFPEGERVNVVGAIAKGIALNAINPSVILFWVATCTIVLNQMKLNHAQSFVFFFLTIGSMFGVDVLKIYFASKLQKHMTPKILALIGIIVGGIMIVAGIFLMCSDLTIPSEIPTRLRH